MEYMSDYQKELYKERQIKDNPSRTYHSDVFQAFDRAQSEQAVPSRNLTSDDDIIAMKLPWGRSRSYAGDGPICLPTEHRPKCEPPLVLQKTHHHFGSGLFAVPRGYPFAQYYDLTTLKKSQLRYNDELIPRPSTSQVHDRRIHIAFPREHPLSSHNSRQALFPKYDNPIEEFTCSAEKTEPKLYLPSLVPESTPPTIVLNKAMGSFARREICTPQTAATRQPLTWPLKDAQRLPKRNTWFSRHEIISEFNKQNPSVIPAIALNIQKKKPADWIVNSARRVST